MGLAIYVTCFVCNLKGVFTDITHTYWPRYFAELLVVWGKRSKPSLLDAVTCIEAMC